MTYVKILKTPSNFMKYKYRTLFAGITFLPHTNTIYHKILLNADFSWNWYFGDLCWRIFDSAFSATFKCVHTMRIIFHCHLFTSESLGILDFQLSPFDTGDHHFDMNSHHTLASLIFGETRTEAYAYTFHGPEAHSSRTFVPLLGKTPFCIQNQSQSQIFVFFHTIWNHITHMCCEMLTPVFETANESHCEGWMNDEINYYNICIWLHK